LGGNLNYAADGISNLFAHRPTTLFPTSSSSRIFFVGEVGDPRASQSVSQAVQAFSVFKRTFKSGKKKKTKSWLNYHHRKQSKRKEGVFGLSAQLCHHY
jgi:hypothetical protein